MEFAEVKTWLEDNKDTDDVKTYLEGLNPLSGLTDGNAHDLVEKNPVLKSYRDGFVNKSINTFKEKFTTDEVPKLVQAEYDKQHPPESEAEKKLNELSIQFEAEKKARIRSELKSLAISAAKDLEIDPDIIAFFVGEDETITNQNIAKLKEVFEGAVSKAVETKMAENSRNVNQGDEGDYTGKNPYSKQHFNMGEQIKLKKTNPELAARLKAQAAAGG